MSRWNFFLMLTLLSFSIFFCFVSSASDENTDVEQELMISEMLAKLDLDQIEKTFDSKYPYSFIDMVVHLCKGEAPFSIQDLHLYIKETLFSEINNQKTNAVRILVIAMASALFGNFIRIFDNRQVSEISFYMLYILITVLLLRSFDGLCEIVSSSGNHLIQFMKAAVPVYYALFALCAGSFSAVGFYQIAVFAIAVLQIVFMKYMIPIVWGYLIFLLLNQMTEEHPFSGITELLEMIISWTIKAVLGFVVGLQSVQCLISPALDSLKKSSIERIIKLIPGFGDLLDGAAELAIGAAVVLKNAVGAAGILTLAILSAIPLLKLIICILLFRLLCALLQPICDKRMAEGVKGMAKASSCLLRIISCSMAVFVLEIALMSASIKGL